MSPAAFQSGSRGSLWAAKPVQRSGIPRSVPCGWTALGARLGREDFRLEVTWLGSGRTWTGIHIFS